jgi:hypothetical protein
LRKILKKVDTKEEKRYDASQEKMARNLKARRRLGQKDVGHRNKLHAAVRKGPICKCGFKYFDSVAGRRRENAKCFLHLT